MIAALLILSVAYAPIVPSSMCDTIMLVDTTYMEIKGGKEAIIDTSYYAVCPIAESLRASEHKLKMLEILIRERRKGK